MKHFKPSIHENLNLKLYCRGVANGNFTKYLWPDAPIKETAMFENTK